MNVVCCKGAFGLNGSSLKLLFGLSGRCPKQIPVRVSSKIRQLSSSASHDKNHSSEVFSEEKNDGRRVWKAVPNDDSPKQKSISGTSIWNQAVDDLENHEKMKALLDDIGMQERQGSRMRQAQLGVLREDPQEDMRLLIENYTVPSLASALRDREDTLQHCAYLLANNKLVELGDMLRPYEQQYVKVRRRRSSMLDLTKRPGFDTRALEMLRKGLMRMPRRVSQPHQHRAGVVLPLCNVNGIPCILFEKRSKHLRAHPDEVCLPGGMVSTINDSSIVATCLREMEEEIPGISVERGDVTVLGVLRCNWGEVHHLVGVAVTPVVCFIGEIGDKDLKPSLDEVSECFTVPLSTFLDRQRWVIRENVAPIFTGGPHIIWGLTGYMVNRFVKDVLARYTVKVPDATII